MRDDVEEIIYFPTVWERNGYGFRIEDLKQDRFVEVVGLFKEYFIPNDVLLKNTRILKEQESLQSFSDRLLYVLENNSSLVVFDENSVIENEIKEYTTEKHVFEKPVKRKIAGVLVLQTITKFDYGRVISRTKLVLGDSMKKLVRLREHMYRQIDFFAKYSCERILRIYYLFVMPKYRHLGLGFHLLLSAVDVARANGASVVIGLFQTAEMQKIAKKVGMTEKHIVHLSNWKENGNPVFGNKITEDCVLMELKVPKHSHLKQLDSIKS